MFTLCYIGEIWVCCTLIFGKKDKLKFSFMEYVWYNDTVMLTCKEKMVILF